MSAAKGLRHLRAEWGRWWRTEDLTDLHIAHRALNDQYRIWCAVTGRVRSDVKQNIGLLRKQQRQTQAMQMQRMAAMRQMRGGGRSGRGYGGGFGLGMMMGGGSSPMISYRTMQWAELEIKLGQREFAPSEVTPAMLAAGRSQARARRHRAALAWITAGVLLWVGVWALSAVAGLTVTALCVLVVWGGAWIAGRNPLRRRPPVPKLLFVPPKPVPGTDEDLEPEPFALREAGRTPRVAREAVRLALARESIPAEVGLPIETAYGWTVPLLLTGGTSADVVRVLGRLATTLRVGENRLLVRRDDPDDAAALTLQLLTTDPFADPLPYPERVPLSCSIRTPMSIGLSIEGETTPVVLAGQHVIIVANTGGGKSASVQALAEYVTACTDAVAVDLDPAKRGLRSLGDAAALRARTPAEVEQSLEWLLTLARARIASLPPTQETWEPTPDGPSVLVFADEFPQFSDLAKARAVELLRIGREAHVTIVLCSQDATREVLGDSIADSFGVRILLPCRAADVPLVIGQPDAISRGWLPHLLIPSPDPDDPADAGRFYCVTPRHRTPVLRYVSKLTPKEAALRAADRVAAGLPPLTLPAAAAPAIPDAAPDVLRALLSAFAAEGDPVELSVARIGVHLARADPDTWGRWEKSEPRQRTAMISRTLTTELARAGLDIPRARIFDADGSRVAAYRLADIRAALPS